MNRLTQALRRAVRGGGLTTALVGLAAILPGLPAWAQVPGWTEWRTLGNSVSLNPAIGRPAIGRNQDGRIEVFVVRADNALWHIWHGGPNDGWSNWESLGGFLRSNPAVGSNQDGRLEVFVRGGDDALYHRWQIRPNGEWAGWKGLGGPEFVGDPVVGRNEDGRLEVFVRARNNSLWHVWQTRPNGTWSGWECICWGDVLGNPVVGRNADGRLEVFYRGADPAGRQGLIHIAQRRPNGTDGQWLMMNLGDLDALNARMQSDPGVAMNRDGRLEAFVRGSDGFLFHRYQRVAGVDDWSPWARLAGDFTRDPVPALNRGNGLSVFMRGFEGALYETVQMRANSSDAYLVPWRRHGFPPAPVLDIAVGQVLDGRMEVFVRSSDGGLYRRFEWP